MYKLIPYIITAIFIFSQPANAKTFNAKTFKLKNDMQVVLIENHRAPVLTHMVWYRAGAADEEVGQSGIAHFLEHLMFKATDKLDNGEFSKTVKIFGGNDNAFTSQNYTAYYQNIPKDRLEEIMQMETDRMQNLKLTDEVVNPERKVIIEERNQRTDNNPSAKLREYINNALYINHPYGIPIIGWRSEMEQLSKQNAIDWYNKWYNPSNAILVVSGDITEDELKELAEKYYGSIPTKPKIARIRTKIPPMLSEQRITFKDERVGSPSFQRQYLAPVGNDKLEIISDVLGGGSTSRLYNRLVIQEKLATSAGTYYDPTNMDVTSFGIYISLIAGSDLSKVEAILDEEIALLLAKGITEDELKSSKSKIKASSIYARDSLQGPAMIFGRALTNGFSMDYIENYTDRIQQLNLTEINDSVKLVFNEDNKPVTGILLSKNKETK